MQEILVDAPGHPDRRDRRGLPLRSPPRGQRRAAPPARARARLRGRSPCRWSSAPTASTSRSARPPSAVPWPAARSTWRPGCSATSTRRGGRSSPATSGAACSASPPPTSRCRTPCASRPTACTPAGTSGPTASVHPCAINLGRRPTFYEHADHSLLEAHLLDFAGDLYGERARGALPDFLRSERKFDGIDALDRPAQARHRVDPPRCLASIEPGQPDDAGQTTLPSVAVDAGDRGASSYVPSIGGFSVKTPMAS